MKNYYSQITNYKSQITNHKSHFNYWTDWLLGSVVCIFVLFCNTNLYSQGFTLAAPDGTPVILYNPTMSTSQIDYRYEKICGFQNSNSTGNLMNPSTTDAAGNYQPLVTLGREIFRWNDKELNAPIRISTSDLAPGLYRIGFVQNGSVLKMKNLIKEQ